MATSSTIWMSGYQELSDTDRRRLTKFINILLGESNIEDICYEIGDWEKDPGVLEVILTPSIKVATAHKMATSIRDSANKGSVPAQFTSWLSSAQGRGPTSSLRA